MPTKNRLKERWLFRELDKVNDTVEAVFRQHGTSTGEEVQSPARTPRNWLFRSRHMHS